MSAQSTFCATLVDEWVRAGVAHAVAAPGSRSTPLALALADAEAAGRLSLRVILDERSAAFFALGLARATQRPVVLLCTSGTAAAHFHAAVLEADLDRVPLIVCTADRPPELRSVGAPQTIEQTHLYGAAVRWYLDPGPVAEQAEPAWRSWAAQAVVESSASPRGPGPVHLNLPFREPLVGTPGPLPPGRPDGRPWHAAISMAEGGQRAPEGVREPALAALSGLRVVVAAGAGSGNPVLLHRVAARYGWPVLADPRSGARLPAATTIAAADALVRVGEAAAALRPDAVLHLGSPWASRLVGEWLAEVPEQILVDPHGAFRDPHRRVGTVVRAHPSAVLSALVAGTGMPAPASWLASWRSAEDAAQAVFDTILGSSIAPLSEPGAARTVAAAVPDGGALVLSSSMPVRDVEWYARPREGLTVHANRGANGIDGVVSTVLGVAAAHDGPTVGLLGDLALLHDANGLLNGSPCNGDRGATLVVIDNQGGGIFEFLAQGRTLPRPLFERLFATPQPVDVLEVAAAYGAATVDVSTLGELRDVVGAAGSPFLRVVRVRTDRVANVAVHDALHAGVADAVRVLGL